MKTRQQTNALGMMIALVGILLIFGTLFNAGGNAGVTGAATGLEGVSGFAITVTKEISQYPPMSDSVEFKYSADKWYYKEGQTLKPVSEMNNEPWYNFWSRQYSSDLKRIAQGLSTKTEPVGVAYISAFKSEGVSISGLPSNAPEGKVAPGAKPAPASPVSAQALLEVTYDEMEGRLSTSSGALASGSGAGLTNSKKLLAQALGTNVKNLGTAGTAALSEKNVDNYYSQRIRNAKGNAAELQKIRNEMELYESGTADGINAYSKANAQDKNSIANVLTLKAQYGTDADRQALASNEETKLILFQAAQGTRLENQNAKRYIDDNLKGESDYYTALLKACGAGCKKDGDNWVNSKGQIVSETIGVGGKTVFQVSKSQQAQATVSAAKTSDSNQYTMGKIEDDLNKYEQGLFEGEIKVVQSGNSLLAMDSQGNFYSIRKDPSDKSKYAIGNRLAEAPSSFKTKDGMDFKKEGDYALNGNKVYSNSKGELFAMNDLNTKIAKGTQLVKSEPFGAMALQSSLVVGDDGKITEQSTRRQVLLNDKLYDIDTDTYNLIKSKKPEEVSASAPSPSVFSIDIGNVRKSFGGEKSGYENKDGKGATGFKRTEVFDTIYVDKDGNKYTEAQINSMDKKQQEELKPKLEKVRIHIKDVSDITDKDALTGQVIVDYNDRDLKSGRVGADVEVKRIVSGNEVAEYYYIEGSKGDPEISGFTKEGMPMKKDGTSNVALFKDGVAQCASGISCPLEFLARADTAQNQYASRQFFSAISYAFTEFRGFGFLGTLFIDDKTLDDLRESVDKSFATLYLGTEYWTSELCSANIDREGQGVAYIDTKMGLAGVAAHIEASKSDPAVDEQGNKEIVYKITFNVKNGDWEEDPAALEEMKFNVELSGERAVSLFKQDVKLARGDQFGKIGQSAVVQASRFDYNQVCLVFDEVPFRWRLSGKKVCNTISLPTGPTSLKKDAEAPSSGSSSAGSGKQAPDSPYNQI